MWISSASGKAVPTTVRSWRSTRCAPCFNYANRLLSGLGVELGEDTIGYYQQTDPGASPARADSP